MLATCCIDIKYTSSQVLDEEKESPREFQPLPFHYIEISKLLFDQQDDGGAPRAGDLSPGEGMMEELHGQKNQSMVDMNNVAVPEERSRVLGAEQMRRPRRRGAGRLERSAEAPGVGRGHRGPELLGAGGGCWELDVTS